MNQRDYNKGILNQKLAAEQLQDRWKIHLISLAFLLSIFYLKGLLILIFACGLSHYYSLYLTRLSMDCYLDDDLEESDNCDTRTKNVNFAVNIMITGIYIALIGKIL